MRRFFALSVAGAMALAAVVACSKSATQEAANGDAGSTPTPTPDNSGDDDTNTPVTNDAGETTQITGLPCDVEAVLQNNCTVCHVSGNPYDAGGTPPPLVTYDDLKQPSTADPTKTRAELAVEYMTAKTMPKPPAQPVDPDEITTIQNWIDAGYPENNTACVEAAPDGGTLPLDAGTADAGTDASTDDGGCATGVFWKNGNQGSQDMHPGEACIACHTAVQGPKYRFAGTVYATSHDPNDCNGDATPVTVTITDKNGKTATATTNAVGNFDLNTVLVAPYNVKLTQGGKTRAMTGTIAAGDCNGCHTPTGNNGAPGRILAP